MELKTDEGGVVRLERLWARVRLGRVGRLMVGLGRFVSVGFVSVA